LTQEAHVPRIPPAVTAALVLAAASAALVWARAESPPLIPIGLPAPDRQLVEFLLLLPVAALVCCVVRVFIGLHTFGTFAPALLGLAFREVESPVGVFVLVLILAAGWVVRRGLTQLNLLQVPRSAIMLSLIVILLIAYILVAHHRGGSVAAAIPVLPLVIVTGLVERFWATEEEDGTPTAVRTMVATLLTGAAVYLVVRTEFVHDLVVGRPESLGLVVAAQIGLGRYTGYRLLELYRFRDLADESPEKS
jgi:hypothetical protein